jgi:hypothetical protein
MIYGAIALVYTQIATANWQFNGDGSVNWTFDPTTHAATGVVWVGTPNIAGYFPKANDKTNNVWSAKGKGTLYPPRSTWKIATDEARKVIFQ